MASADKKQIATVKGWVFLIEGSLSIFGAIGWLVFEFFFPLLPWLMDLFIVAGLLVPALWFIKHGRASLAEARRL